MSAPASRFRRPGAVTLISALALATVLMLFFLVRWPPQAPPPTDAPEQAFPPAGRERLHVSDAELAIWRSRAEEGPYKVQGDVSTNSPGDWARISQQAQEFLSDPGAARWPGPQNNNPDGCVLRRGGTSGNLGHQPPVEEASWLRDAAFVAMVDGREHHAEAVRREMLAQAREPGVDFGDRERWCLGEIMDGSPGFMIATWLTKYLYAMNYLEEYDKDIFTSEERARLLGWFSDAAEWMRHDTDEKIGSVFVDRDDGDYTLTERASDGESRPVYYGGPEAGMVAQSFNNRNAREARFVTLVGITTDNRGFVDHGKRYVRDALAYTYFPQGAVGDFQRWTDDDPTLGWKYGAEFVGSLLTIADHLARAGDTDLYEYGTADGAAGSEGRHHTGGPKTLETLVTDMMKYVDHSYARYGTDDADRAGDPDYLIDTTVDTQDQALINDTMMLMANTYYQDAYIRAVYTRQAEGAPSYPERPRHGSGDPESGEAGTYPGALFMFGKTEGRVWPYGKLNASTRHVPGSGRSTLGGDSGIRDGRQAG